MLKGQDACEDLRSRFEVARTNGLRWISLLTAAVRYAVPTMDGLNILQSYNDAAKNIEYYVENTTPQMAADTRASQLHSLILPAGRRWGNIYTNGKFNDELTEEVFEIMQKSNIHSVAHSLFLDLTIGTGALWMDSPSKQEPLRFKALTGVAILPEFDDTNNPKNVWFKRAINDLELKEYGVKVDHSFKTSENINFLTCGFLYNRREGTDTPIYNIKHATQYKWLYVEVLNDAWESPLKMEAKRFKQLHLINDTMRAGESRGRGIALRMLEDITYLNDITGSLKDGIRLKAKPPILANPSIGNLNFANMSGGVLPSTLAVDGVPLLQPMQWEFDVKSVAMLKMDLEQKIKNAFNVMPYGMINEGPVRSATEIRARETEAERQSVTDVSRMVFDLDNMFKEALNMLVARGSVGKGEHHITFKNPMLGMENQVELNNLLQYKQMTDQLINPNWSQLVNDSRTVDTYLKDKLNIPEYFKNSPENIQKGIDRINELANSLDQKSQPTNVADPMSPVGLGEQYKIGGFGI